MATLTISFTAPSEVPDDGYIVKYKKTSDSVYTTVTPNPTSSPVVITGLSNGDYEGTIQSDCGAIASGTAAFTASALVIPVTVNYSMTKDADPHVDLALVMIRESDTAQIIYPTSTGTLSGTFSGDSLAVSIIHQLAFMPWPDSSSARLIIKKDGVEIYNSGLITDPELEELADETIVLEAGSEYDIEAVSNSTSVNYDAASFSLNNLSSLANPSLTFEFYDQDTDEQMVHTQQFLQPHNNISLNWPVAGTYGKLKVINPDLAQAVDVQISNILEGGSYDDTLNVLPSADNTKTNLPKTGYTLTITDTGGA